MDRYLQHYKTLLDVADTQDFLSLHSCCSHGHRIESHEEEAENSGPVSEGQQIFRSSLVFHEQRVDIRIRELEADVSGVGSKLK